MSMFANEKKLRPTQVLTPFCFLCRPTDPSLWSCRCLPIIRSCKPIWRLPTPSAASAVYISTVGRSCGSMCTITTSPASCAFAMHPIRTLLLLKTSLSISGMHLECIGGVCVGACLPKCCVTVCCDLTECRSTRPHVA